MKPSLLAAGALFLVSNLTFTHAATVTVCDEPGLRSAIASGGTILFDCDGTITLSNTLHITSDTILDGNGRTVTISGGKTVRVFWVNPGIRFTVRNLGIANGSVIGTNSLVPSRPGEDAFGAGIYNRGTLVLVDCVLSNHATRGGMGGPYSSPAFLAGSGGKAEGAAIYNAGGSVWSTNVTFARNSAVGGKGGDGGFSGPEIGAGGSAFGGAFFSESGVYGFVASRFSGNSASGGEAARGAASAYGLAGSAFGGAICHLAATGTVIRSEFAVNRAVGASIAFTGVGTGAGIGGALYASNGIVAVKDGSFVSNRAESGRTARFAGLGPAQGGAIGVSCFAEIDQCFFSANSAFAPVNGGPGTDASGGAISNHDLLSVISSTFANNSALGGHSGSVGSPGASWPAGNAYGGAIHNRGTLGVTNSTFARNLAQGGNRAGFTDQPGGAGNGGAIANSNALMVSHVTLGSNSAVQGASIGISLRQGFGGGIHNAGGATAILQNSIIAGNISGSNAFGVLSDQGNNLSSDASCQFNAPGSLNNTDPVLSPLDDFGGPTPTMALLAGSPAINAGLPLHCTAIDQRGVTRPSGHGCDIGAFESAPPYTVRGTIHGYKPLKGISVAAGSSSGTSDSAGKYILFGLAAGSHTIVPSSSEAVCNPNSRSVDITSDTLGIDFKAYRFNALTIDGVSNQGLAVVYAGAPGQVRAIQKSPLLEGPWTSFSTNTVGPEGLFTFDVPVTPATHEYFRAGQP